MPELLNRVSSRELTEWMAYDQLEPLPDRRQDLLLASLLALLSNVYRDAKKHREPAEPGDFLPWLRLDEPDPEPVDMLAKIEALNALFGGEDRRAAGAAKLDGPDGGVDE